MITYVSGKLVEKSPTSAVIETAGIGYNVLIPISTYDCLPAAGDDVKLLTHHHVREDAQILFGFATDAERIMFRRLLDVNGVGPRLALSVLSGLSVRDLKTAIVSGDNKRLSGISGIGKKTAERIVVELRDKISDGEAMEAISGADKDVAGSARIRDAVMALVALGYKQPDALKLVRKAAENAGDDSSVEQLIKRALAG